MFEQKCTEIINRYRTSGLMIATAESCTGGLLSGALTQVAGSSDVFERGFVTYSYLSKTELLGVSQALLEQVGAVSQEVAQAMALGALQGSDANVALSITGVAGPGASQNKPEGLVCFSLAASDGTVEVIEKRFGALGRTEVRKASVEQALNMLMGHLNP